MGIGPKRPRKLRNAGLGTRQVAGRNMGGGHEQLIRGFMRAPDAKPGQRSGNTLGFFVSGDATFTAETSNAIPEFTGLSVTGPPRVGWIRVATTDIEAGAGKIDVFIGSTLADHRAIADGSEVAVSFPWIVGGDGGDISSLTVAFGNAQTCTVSAFLSAPYIA